MTKVKTNIVTDAFKKTFVRTDGCNTEELQKAFFAMGFRWAGGHTPHRNIINNMAGETTYIRVDENCELWCCGDKETPNDYEWLEGYKEMPWNWVLICAEKVRASKRYNSKHSKKRRAARKFEASFIPHTQDGVCPVSPDTVVTYRMRNGVMGTNKAGDLRWNFWKEEEWQGDGDIVAYKVHKPARNSGKRTQKLVSLDDLAAISRFVPMEDMVEAIAWDLGKGVAVPVHDLDKVVDKDGKVVAEGNFVRDTSVPDTNPKRQYGVASIPLNMWSPLASAYGSLGLYNGAGKYGKANFANTPVEASIYIAAAMRHLNAWACGQEFDPADGVPNLGGVLANIAILLEARAAGTLIDDRLKMSGYLKELDALKEIVKHLNVLHADKNPKHYTLEG